GGLIEPASLSMDQAEQMQGVGMARIGRERLPAAFLGGPHPVCPEVPEAGLVERPRRFLRVRAALAGIARALAAHGASPAGTGRIGLCNRLGPRITRQDYPAIPLRASSRTRSVTRT